MSADAAAPDTGDFLEEIRTTSLPDRVEVLADEYERVCGERDRFLWQWIYSLFPEFTLSSVDPAHADHVRTQKTILTMYVTILDDIVENDGDRDTFEEARRLVQNPSAVDPRRAAVSDEYFAFIERVWREFESGLADAPRVDEFADIFQYDMRQTLNAMDYSAVVNENPRIANLSGAERYGAHNMVMFPYADVDLMYSPDFVHSDFGTVRDLLWDLQEMARIGNWLTTWEREVKEGDYTAGIVVLALQEGLVSPSDLSGSDDRKADIIEKIKAEQFERRFRDRWADRYRAVRDREFDTESVDLDALVRGMETVFQYHEASRGHK
ncbi:terpene synthase family protein [Haloarcula salina]|uniref:terpene synthase family protein n=1 Tax=Haloarcula salina TaxID=1429914 RepID=UPI003C6FA426